MTPPERSVEVTHKILGNIELILIEKRLDGSDIADIWETLKPTIEHTIHQELRKARHDWLREEIVKLEGMKIVPALGRTKNGKVVDFTTEYDLGKNNALQTIIDRYLSELDQPNK